MKPLLLFLLVDVAPLMGWLTPKQLPSVTKSNSPSNPRILVNTNTVSYTSRVGGSNIGTRMSTISSDTSIAHMTVPELKEHLRKRGLKVSD